jgi:hypothetical protein
MKFSTQKVARVSARGIHVVRIASIRKHIGSKAREFRKMEYVLLNIGQQNEKKKKSERVFTHKRKRNKRKVRREFRSEHTLLKVLILQKNIHFQVTPRCLMSISSSDSGSFGHSKANLKAASIFTPFSQKGNKTLPIFPPVIVSAQLGKSSRSTKCVPEVIDFHEKEDVVQQFAGEIAQSVLWRKRKKEKGIEVMSQQENDNTQEKENESPRESEDAT